MREVTFDRGRSWQALGSYSLAVEGAHPPPYSRDGHVFLKNGAPERARGKHEQKGPCLGNDVG